MEKHLQWLAWHFAKSCFVRKESDTRQWRLIIIFMYPFPVLHQDACITTRITISYPKLNRLIFQDCILFQRFLHPNNSKFQYHHPWLQVNRPTTEKKWCASQLMDHFERMNRKKCSTWVVFTITGTTCGFTPCKKEAYQVTIGHHRKQCAIRREIHQNYHTLPPKMGTIQPLFKLDVFWGQSSLQPTSCAQKKHTEHLMPGSSWLGGHFHNP